MATIKVGMADLNCPYKLPKQFLNPCICKFGNI